MTGVGWAAIGLVGGVAGLAFALVLVLARRLRDLTDRVARLDIPFFPDLPDPGPVPPVEATTTAGQRITAETFAGADRVVAFLSGSCDSCHEILPHLRAELATGSAGAGPLVIAVGRPELTRSIVETLAPVADVVEEIDMSGLTLRFGVRGFPSFLLIGDGEIKAAAHSIGELELSGERVGAMR